MPAEELANVGGAEMDEESADISSVAKGTEYEQFVKGVYETLLKAEGIETISIQHNVNLAGKSGCEHQIDVYWEFKVAGEIYKTAIECKAFNQSVSIGRIRDFYGVLIDIPNLNGIFATLVGYQSGAKAYAQHYGITLKEVRLPNAQDWEGRIKDVMINFIIVDPNIDEFSPIFSPHFLQSLTEPLSVRVGIYNHNPLIFDSSGNSVATYEQLRTSLPTVGAPFTGHEHIFNFPGHTMRTADGEFPIEGIKVKYSVQQTTNSVKIEGEKLAHAIVRDVKTGGYTFIRKDGGASQPGSP